MKAKLTTEELKNIFSSILENSQILTSNGDLEHYGKDSSTHFQGNAGIILFPVKYNEVQNIVKLCNEKKIALVPSGGRTGYSGGATALNGEAVISLEKLNKFLEIDTKGMTITCQAGVTTQAVQDYALKNGFFYGVDFASKGSSQIGGNVATNAGGVRVIRYGNTRDWVLGIKVVTGSGELIDLNGSLVKNQTGYDFRHLFIGSEGTLGIIVEVTLKLSAIPKGISRAICGFSNLELVTPLLSNLRHAGFTVNLFEYFDNYSAAFVLKHKEVRAPLSDPFPAYALIEVETISSEQKESFQEYLISAFEDGKISDVTVAISESQEKEFLSFRELIPQTINHFGFPHKNDISVPVKSVTPFIVEYRKKIEEFLDKDQILIFGHIGDGNLHVNLLKPESQDANEFFQQCKNLEEHTYAIIQKYHGSISAEHGIGILKKPYLLYSRNQIELDWMIQIKKIFDPNEILNPGKLGS